MDVSQISWKSKTLDVNICDKLMLKRKIKTDAEFKNVYNEYIQMLEQLKRTLMKLSIQKGRTLRASDEKAELSASDEKAGL